VYSKVIKTGGGKYCSRVCYYKSKIGQFSAKRVKRICQKCGKEFEIREYLTKKGCGIFCSRKCKNTSQIKRTIEEKKEYYREWYLKNKYKQQKYFKQYQKSHKKEIKEYNDQLYLKNRLNFEWVNKKNERNRRYYYNNIVKNQIQHKKYRQANAEKIRINSKVYRQKHPDKSRITAHKSYKKICSTLCGKLNKYMGRVIYQACKVDKAGRHWEDLVDYTLNELKNHLESLFTPGMTWDNYGRYGWHIDHIKPKVSFHYEYPEDLEFKECWSLSNLQPLWATTRVINNIEYIGNLNKGANYK